MRRHALPVGLLLAGLLALVSCAATPTGPQQPQRPRTVQMNGTDPCQLLTTPQVTELSLDPRSQRPHASAESEHSPGCGWGSPVDITGKKPFEGVFIQAVTYLSVDDVFARAHDEKTWMTVQGFRALGRVNTSSARDLAYQVWVDVADGQSLNVAYTIDGWTGEVQDGNEQARQKAVHAADLAVTTLLGR